MMDQQNYGASGLFGSYGGGYGASDPSLNIPGKLTKNLQVTNDEITM